MTVMPPAGRPLAVSGREVIIVSEVCAERTKDTKGKTGLDPCP
jgi:hypothetical protein